MNTGVINVVWVTRGVVSSDWLSLAMALCCRVLSVSKNKPIYVKWHRNSYLIPVGVSHMTPPSMACTQGWNRFSSVHGCQALLDKNPVQYSLGSRASEVVLSNASHLYTYRIRADRSPLMGSWGWVLVDLCLTRRFPAGTPVYSLISIDSYQHVVWLRGLQIY